MPGNLDALSRIKRSTIIIKVYDNNYTHLFRRKKLFFFSYNESRSPLESNKIFFSLQHEDPVDQIPN